MVSMFRTVGARMLLVLAVIASGASEGRASSQRAPAPQQETALMVAEQAVAGESAICDAVFVRMSGGGRTVLASADASGRRFCNGVLLIRASGRKPAVVQTIDSWQVENVSSLLVDLDGDGNQELVAPAPFTDYEGASCISVVPVVYRCSAEGCAAATEFANYYRSRAQALTEAMSAASEESLPCLQATRDKLLRMSGQDPTAGFSLAEEWMKSSDDSLRRKAVVVLGDIGDERSRALLKVLAKDPDSTVAQTAQRRLQPQ